MLKETLFIWISCAHPALQGPPSLPGSIGRDHLLQRCLSEPQTHGAGPGTPHNTQASDAPCCASPQNLPKRGGPRAPKDLQSQAGKLTAKRALGSHGGLTGKGLCSGQFLFLGPHVVKSVFKNTHHPNLDFFLREICLRLTTNSNYLNTLFR